MGYFRLRKSVGLGKLVRVNLSKTGVSVSLGPRGATFNRPLISTRKRRSRVTLGAPGSGLSYQIGVSRPRKLQSPAPVVSLWGWLVLIGIGFLLLQWIAR
jgi:hypothetical protein